MVEGLHHILRGRLQQLVFSQLNHPEGLGEMLGQGFSLGHELRHEELGEASLHQAESARESEVSDLLTDRCQEVVPQDVRVHTAELREKLEVAALGLTIVRVDGPKGVHGMQLKFHFW